MSRQSASAAALLQYLQENNQLPVMFADVRARLAVAAVVHGATVTDTEGNVIDTDEFFGPPADYGNAAKPPLRSPPRLQPADNADARAANADADATTPTQKPTTPRPIPSTTRRPDDTK